METYSYIAKCETINEFILIISQKQKQQNVE